MLAKLSSYLVAVAVTLLRLTVRIQFHNDPRPMLRKQGTNYLFSFLHAHQLGLIIGREKGTGAMVSRSKDGELIVPLLKFCGCVPVRGSNRVDRKDRGGREALHTLTDHVLSGKPAALAVDGPRGPRGRVHKGIAALSQQTGAPVLNIVAITRRKWTATNAWDRMQIPLPFSRLDGYFAEPIYPRADEKLEAYRQRIEASLHRLEAIHEPSEAMFNEDAAHCDDDNASQHGTRVESPKSHGIAA
ncbi:MAG: lysophospholipid acyltransferase family protein [Planctomycetaceae bacterium]